jgi:hypothetical protein
MPPVGDQRRERAKMVIRRSFGTLSLLLTTPAMPRTLSSLRDDASSSGLFDRRGHGLG